MAERVETVRLLMNISNYLANSEQVRLANKKVVADSTAGLALQRQAFTQAGIALTGLGVVAAAAVAVSVAKFAEFDAAMSNVKAATQESTDNMVLLREAALEAGASTVYTATQAAGAIEELGKNGLSTAQILEGGLAGALALATSGQLDVARAAEVASITMKQFGLSGKDVPHIADLLAAGAGKAAGSVEDMAQALAQSGLVAHQYGLTVEETTGLLSAFADKGLVGSDAGTSLKTMLQSLTPTSNQAKEALKDLGASAYDGAGQFIGIAKFAGLYSDAMHKLTPEVQSATSKVIFGSDAVRASNVLYDLGAKGIQKYIDQTNDSGYAAKVAADRLDNLKGDVEKLGGAFDTFAIQSGSGANDTLRTLTQSLTFLVDAAGDIPGPVLDIGLALGTAVTAVGLLGGGALTAIPKIADFKAGLDDLHISAGKVGMAVGITAGAIAIASIGIGIWVSEQAKAKAIVESLATTLDEQTAAITSGTREMIKENLAAKQSWWFIEGDSTFDAAEKLGISLDVVTDAASGNVSALKKLKEQLTYGKLGSTEYEAALKRTGLTSGELAIAVGAVTEGVAGEAKSLEEAIRITEQKNKVTNDAADASELSARKTELSTDALSGMQGAAVGARDEISKLAAEIRGFGDATLNTRDAQRQFQQSIDSAHETLQAQIDAYVEANGSLDGFVASLDIGTEAGRANEATLDAIAQASKDVAASLIEQSGDQEVATAAIANGRQALIDQLAQYGITGQAAEDYADSLGLIPENIVTAVAVNGLSEAQALIDGFVLTNNGRTVSINVATSPADEADIVRYLTKRADGGPIFGVGGPRQDNIPIMASVGEHMLDAEDVQRMGGHAGVFAFRRSLYRGYADGGPVMVRPQYVSAPQYAHGVSAAPVSSSTKIDLNVVAEDPAAASERVYQRLNAAMSTR